MSAIPFVTLDEPRYGVAVQVSPLVRRVIANNPSKYTYLGTGTYIIGHGDVAVVDPGPVLDEHRDSLRAALEGNRVRAILVTHCHSDHSPLSSWLRDETGAPTIAFGPHGVAATDPEIDDEIEPGVTLEETTDTDFDPDVRVGDGEVAAMGAGWTMRAVYTPGHTSNHMCYALDEEQALFTGDHVMGWSTTVVSPPDGDMRSYIDSLRKVMERNDASSVAHPRCAGDVTAAVPACVSRTSARTRSAGARCCAVGPFRHRGNGQADVRRRARGASQGCGTQRAVSPHQTRRRWRGHRGGQGQICAVLAHLKLVGETVTTSSAKPNVS